MKNVLAILLFLFICIHTIVCEVEQNSTSEKRIKIKKSENAVEEPVTGNS